MDFIPYQTTSANRPGLKLLFAPLVALDQDSFSSVSLPWRQRGVVQFEPPAHCLNAYNVWQCDDCIVSRSDISMGMHMMRLRRKRLWWSMTGPPLQGRGPFRPYISGDRGEFASFSMPA